MKDPNEHGSSNDKPEKNEPDKPAKKKKPRRRRGIAHAAPMRQTSWSMLPSGWQLAQEKLPEVEASALLK